MSGSKLGVRIKISIGIVVEKGFKRQREWRFGGGLSKEEDDCEKGRDDGIVLLRSVKGFLLLVPLLGFVVGDFLSSIFL